MINNKNTELYKVAIRSPLQHAKKLSELLSCDVFLKREDLQPVHSFKIRGAYNKISSLTQEEKDKGVIAASAGNHAQGVALSSQKLGIDALIIMPKTTPSIKVDAVVSYGAKVILHGDNYSEAQEKCNELIVETGRTFIHPFDDPLVIDGQGTIGAEILEQLPDVTHVFVCVGGGGMLAGIAKLIKKTHPQVKIISVEPDDSAAMHESIKAGRRVELDHVGIFADGVAVKKVGKLTFKIAQKYVDDFIKVSIDEVCAGIKSVFEETRSIVEPAGALAVAGVKTYDLPINSKAVAICSGANMVFERLQFISERTLVGSNNEALYSVEIPEKPAALQKFCKTVIHGHSITEFNYRLNNRGKAQFFVGLTISDNSDKLKLEKLMKMHEFPFTDLTLDDIAKEHTRHMIGGPSPNARDEVFYHIGFPERPQALQSFLNAIGTKYNISLFHYRSLGGGIGRVLMGFECDDPSSLEQIFTDINYDAERVTSKSVDLFLK